MIDLGFDRDPAAMRIVVAMSGGVDSSACAALLFERGYEVLGVTLRLYDLGAAAERPGACCAGRDIDDARRVADRIGIPHYVLDFEDRFRQAVIDDFADSYLKGETPNPCIRCNQTVKFTDLLAKSRELGAHALATGHYALRLIGPEGPELHRGADPGRDQSYFLFATTADQLQYLRFPLGGMDKAETRRIARRFALPVADKPDSQDICFVPEGSYGEVVGKLRPGRSRPGDIVDRQGRVLGGHRGIVHFTVGQRRGLGVAAAEPLYVLALEAEAARVVVGPKRALRRKRLFLKDVNWLGGGAFGAEGAPVSVRLRSAAPAVPAAVHKRPDGGAEVVFAEPQEGIAPGQACVFYDGGRLMGGGWIVREGSRAVSR